MNFDPPGSDRNTTATLAGRDRGTPEHRNATETPDPRGEAETPGPRDAGHAGTRFRHEIGPDVVLTGRIHFPADARVDGRLRGEVHADTLLLIGVQAEVEARVRARHLIIEGTLSGDVIESGHVELRATARMVGSIEARSLAIEDGARFEGSARTLSDRNPIRQQITGPSSRESSEPAHQQTATRR
jgi:cytoskeletal protein CcmA (bactofilin family)